MSLTGPIPESFGNLGNLRDIRMQGNALTGPIPETMADLNGLEILNLSGNQLTGTIPAGTYISFDSNLCPGASAF
jgi:Leucine-rich repeat (LRR) protein